jgi:myo-inositol 2-dehydrogenase/D-chiro-inositol 1-dehydrogenase
VTKAAHPRATIVARPTEIELFSLSLHRSISMSSDIGASRRDFLKTTAAAAGILASQGLVANAHAAGSDTIKVGLIGCGGRGSGAADNVLHAAKGVSIVALGDAFKDRAEGCRNRLRDIAGHDEKIKELGNTVDLPDDRVFVGLDAFEKVIASGANYIILATPPGFRPGHIEAVVRAGKTLFSEKPVAVDGPGIRRVLAAYDEAKRKNLAIVAGTQRRHQLGYVETMKRIHDGAIGEVVAGRAYWNQGILWKVARAAGMSDLVWQLRNWYNFVWLCGDHIVEQHIHNLDVCNWAFNSHPVKARGMGGRQRSVPHPEEYGHIWDHFAVEYDYPNGGFVLSQCRQINQCWNSVSEHLHGSKGQCHADAYTLLDINGKNGTRIISREEAKQATDPYVQEHTDLIACVRSGQPINELKNVAESTLTAILGRMSSYTGKEVTWDQALNSQEELMPAKLDWDMSLEVPPVALMGKTSLT